MNADALDAPDGASTVDAFVDTIPGEVGTDASRPVPASLRPCVNGACWFPVLATDPCGAVSRAEDFSSGRYNVHRYRLSVRRDTPGRIELRRTSGTFAPALVLARLDGTVLSDGAISDPSGSPRVVVVDAGRTGDIAVTTVASTADLEVDVYVTSWSVLGSDFMASMPTDVAYSLTIENTCPALPPGAGIAPANTMTGELMAVGTQSISMNGTWGAPYRVDARAGEHITFRLGYATASADVRWEVYRFDGRASVQHASNDYHDRDEWEGIRTVAVLDPAEPRTWWIRFRREGGGALDASLTIGRTPFVESAVCMSDCDRLLVIPQRNGSSDGYDVPGHTIYTWQFGRRDLLMAIRHAGRRMAATGTARFTVKDLSRWDGLVWAAHSTHQNGFHADISLIDAAGNPIWGPLCTPAGDICAAGTVRNFGAEHMARMIDALFDSGHIQWVLLDHEYHAPLLAAVDALIARGVIDPTRRPLFDATTPACAGRPCVRHVVSHLHHVHIGIGPM